MAPSPTIRRLLKETQELSGAAKHPNPAFHAAPLSEDNLHEWHFTLLGPPAPSPYASGIYHGRITLPPAYPMKPPNFRFLTPSGRFEVNREICLSISGFHEETWQPAWGVRLALTALRGFMGEEGTAGQVGGLESPKEVRERLAKQSTSWKCPGCGGDEEGENRRGWTNEERMKWWWDVCRSKGVNVEAEIEGLEDLPEGMKVEAREVKQEKGKQKDESPAPENRAQEAQAQPATQSLHQIEASSTPTVQQLLQNHASDSASLQPADITARETQEPGIASDVPQLQYAGHNDIATPARQSQQPPQQLRQIQQLPTQRSQQADSPVTIDRAITAVFIALFIMILKKVFYPSSAGPLFGGYDELRMVRE